MNARIQLLIATALLALGIGAAAAAERDPDAPLGQAIAQQGNQALAQIRAELATALHREATLPALRVIGAAGQTMVLAASREPSMAPQQ
ncbi:hypothetical protein AAG565_02040 [Fontimonas sp. SYSU GA230001]|uniref:hypothetical protein n=1 Tax=Fontimonas sp. SYSU GA230001 TaxID=3142450 RepID=UPI0032B48CA0